MGYQAVAFGFFEDDVQFVHTTGWGNVKPNFVEYVRAVMIAGKVFACLNCVILIQLFHRKSTTNS